MGLPSCISATQRWLVKNPDSSEGKLSLPRTPRSLFKDSEWPMSPSSAFSGFELDGLPSTWVKLDSSYVASEASVLLEDRKVLAELSESMVGQLNNMYAFMNHSLGRERARHASDVSLMMRKVDKDLKDTFKNVRDTFTALTDQLLQLVREVENGRKQVKSIQSKFQATKQAAEAQAQYVAELEAVIDSQGAGVTDVLQKLSAQASSSAQAAEKDGDDARQRERFLKNENTKLRIQLKRFEQTEKAENGVPPHQLPEMAASWTRRGQKTNGQQNTSKSTVLESPAVPSRPSGQPPSNNGSNFSDEQRPTSQQSAGAVSFGVCDVVGSMLAHSDATRNVSRTKNIKPTTRQPKTHGIKPGQRELSGIRKRAETAEAHCQRQHRLIAFSSTSLVLLRDVFTELKAHHYISANDGRPDVDTGSSAKATEVLDRIVRLFYVTIPKLGNFSEIVSALNDEIARPLPWANASTNDSLGPLDSRTTAVTSVSVHSAYSDGSDAFHLASTSEDGTY